MAADMRHFGANICGMWLMLWVCTVPAICQGQELTDPTMPPAELSAGAGQVGTGGLQSIIISGGRRAAIINGQTVELGGKIGDVRLIEINESGVVLQGAKGRHVLTLFPSVKKTSRKAMSPSVEDETKDPARDEEAVGQPAAQAGKEEEHEP